MADFYIKRGDLLPVLFATLKNANDSPVDLTGSTVTFFMQWPDRPDKPRIGGVAFLVDDPVGGKVKYIWQAGNTNEAGLYRGEWRVTYPGGRQTFPNNRFVEVLIVDGLAIPETNEAAHAQDFSDAVVIP